MIRITKRHFLKLASITLKCRVICLDIFFRFFYTRSQKTENLRHFHFSFLKIGAVFGVVLSRQNIKNQFKALFIVFGIFPVTFSVRSFSKMLQRSFGKKENFENCLHYFFLEHMENVKKK